MKLDGWGSGTVDLEVAGGAMNMTETYYMKLKKKKLTFKNKNKRRIGFSPCTAF